VTRNKPCTAAVSVLTLLAVAIGGCVTEQVGPRDRSGFDRSMRDRGVAVVPPSRLGQPAADLSQFEGSIAPALGATTQRSRVNVALQPLGQLPYDGLSLPVVSPDGRFLATRVGTAPNWADVLGVSVGGEAPGVSPPGEIRVFRVVESDAARRRPATLERVRFSQPLPDDLLLGRSGSMQGVLVEQQLESGARRIGVVDWGSGSLRWLVDDGALNAMATWTADGGLAWMRRSTGENATVELVLLRADEVSAALRSGRAITGVMGTPRGERVVFGAQTLVAIPVAPADPGWLGVLAVDGRGEMSWHALSARNAGSSGAGSSGASGWVLRTTRRVASGVGVMHAYQAVASTGTPVWTPTSSGVGSLGVDARGGRTGVSKGIARTSVSFVHPGFSDVAVFDLEGGEIRRLWGESVDLLSAPAASGIAAAPAMGSGSDDGWLVTTGTGISIRWPDDGGSQGGRRTVGGSGRGDGGGVGGGGSSIGIVTRPPVEVISWGGLARATPFGASEFLVIGPSPRSDGWWLFVQRLGFVTGE